MQWFGHSQQTPKLRHAAMPTHAFTMPKTGGFPSPPCFVHLIALFWPSVGMPQLGRLLVRPNLLKTLYMFNRFNNYIIYGYSELIFLYIYQNNYGWACTQEDLTFVDCELIIHWRAYLWIQRLAKS